MIGRHCGLFAVKREVLNPIAKPTGYTGADSYKMLEFILLSFQVGREKFLIPWFLVINRKGSEVLLIDVHLRYSGSDLHGVMAKVINMPHSYVETHPNIRKQFWDPEQWLKHVLVRYTWRITVKFGINGNLIDLMGSESVWKPISLPQFLYDFGWFKDFMVWTNTMYA
ncbi:hypothetical protein GIB67_029646 [Kingdonia uniflora]|uniref:Uncharacterized protein n=1 Tax=Kingdonia uniflora TaxID=39325 RepID=A0A7J7LLF5_9MAGN|nr:hypothetical protein GIB67_029646 [Kingdonia uniflora]